jgi:hypothetical protein
MKSTGMFIAGGLLAGAGQAITKAAEERRQNALLALKRQWDTEDTAVADQHALDVEAAKAQGRVLEIQATGEQNRQTEGVKRRAGPDDRRCQGHRRGRKTAEFKGNIDLSHDRAIEGLKHNYNLSEIQARCRGRLPEGSQAQPHDARPLRSAGERAD